MHDLAMRVRLDPVLSKTTVVAPLSLQHEIERAFRSEDYSKNAGPLLYRYGETVKQGGRERLYFPTHINGNHWVPMGINFKSQTLRYGEYQILHNWVYDTD